MEDLWRLIGELWAILGRTLGHLGLHWGVLELPWDCVGDDFGLIWASSEKKCPPGHPSQADGSQVPRLRTKIDPLEFARRFRRSRRSRRNGPRSTVQDLPSTRAGDQDDVSFTNSLKLESVWINSLFIRICLDKLTVIQEILNILPAYLQVLEMCSDQIIVSLSAEITSLFAGKYPPREPDC